MAASDTYIGGMLVQNSPAWDDLRFPINAIKLPAAGNPQETAYKDGIILEFEAGADDTCYFNAQVPHSCKLGTDLCFHLHIVLPAAGAGLGAENIKFDLTYSWSNINGAQPNSTTLTNTRDVQNDSADTHYLFDLGTVLESNATGTDNVSGMLICSLKRDTAVANNYGSSVYLMEADFHYQINTLGSDQETSKSV